MAGALKRAANSLRTHSKRAALLALALALLSGSSAAWIWLKAGVAQQLIAIAWARGARGVATPRPWPWADTHPVARLIIGTEAHALVVLEGDSGRNLAFGPAHDSASVLPGATGNSIIAGHRDTHFRVLQHLHVGDIVRTELADATTTAFAVTDIRVVDSRQWRLALQSATPRLTLVTCYPFDAVIPGGPLRLVVTADRITAARAGG
jgi:sortase A